MPTAPFPVAIVDDDESIGRAFSRLLRATGFQPTEFHSAEEFLDSPQHADFDCLLVDINLGGMSGLGLLRRLRAQGVRTPLIFVSAHDDPAVRAEAIEAGAAGFFRKTDEGERIIAALEAFCAR